MILMSGEQLLEWFRNGLTHLLVLVQHQFQVALVALEPGFLLHDGYGGIRNLDSQPGQPFCFMDQFQNSEREELSKNCIEMYDLNTVLYNWNDIKLFYINFPTCTSNECNIHHIIESFYPIFRRYLMKFLQFNIYSAK